MLSWMKAGLGVWLVLASAAHANPNAARDCEARLLGFRHDPIEQWLVWEKQANLAAYREEPKAIGLAVARVPREDVSVRFDIAVPAEIAQLLTRGDQVFWAKHPYNNEQAVPFQDEATVENWQAHLTASRSVVIRQPGVPLFSLKLPTNHPHVGEEQDNKPYLNEDVRLALPRTAFVRRVDAAKGVDPKMLFLEEIGVLQDKASRNGIVVRDLRPLTDGFFYLPAFSIPYVGRKIAEINGAEFGAFWQRHYAEAIGRAKAKLLLRYGLQMSTPNAQNILVQLDQQLHPTGKIVFRDSADTDFLSFVAHPLGFEADLRSDLGMGYEAKNILKPYAENSFWHMDEAEDGLAISEPQLDSWIESHNKAYLIELCRELGCLDWDLPRSHRGNVYVSSADEFLRSERGQAALKAYALRANKKKDN